MRYICKTIGEIKYLEKILKKPFVKELYYSFNKTNYISIFDEQNNVGCGFCNTYCEECEGCYCIDTQPEYLKKYINVCNILREEKLKRILR